VTLRTQHVAHAMKSVRKGDGQEEGEDLRA
jgi:hypothetical protein